MVFDSIKNVLVGPDGRLTPFRAVVAGFGAGVAESTFAVTPFESIKTQLVDMNQKSKSQNLGFIRGMRFLLAEKGPRVLLQGWMPTQLGKLQIVGSDSPLIQRSSNSSRSPVTKLELWETSELVPQLALSQCKFIPTDWPVFVY